LSRRFRAPLAVALLFLMVLGSLPLLAAAAALVPNTPPTVSTGISLSVIPTRLPADGNTYPALIVTLVDATGNPTLALNTTTVYLSSSQENVATLTGSVTIQTGHGYAVANVTTTQTPGTTTVTASATGSKSSQVVVATSIPSGYATALKITPQPANVFARPGGFGSVVIQLQDDTGLPAKAAFNTNVSLSSSNNGIAQLDQKWVIIPTGDDLAVVNYTSGYAIGQAFITATATGFSAGTTSLGVVGSPPYALKVSAEPSEAVLSTTDRVVVWLTDQAGNPARASSPVSVTLTSSNLTVLSVSPTVVTIPTGQISAVATFTTTSENGNVSITASAQGLLSAFDTVSTSSAKDTPAALTIIAAPDPILADNGQYAAVVVAVVDSPGNRPDVVAANTIVTITSSDTAVGSVTTQVTIPAGGEFAVANITSTYLVGSTTITASAQGLLSAQAQETAFGPIPVSVVVTPVASTISADGATYSALTVSLQDTFGNPAVAPSNIVVQLTSSRPDILSVISPVIIQTGQTYAFATVKTGLSPGASNITASASGYSASSTLLTTVVPAPDKVALYIGPNSTVNSAIAPDALLTVQLQDINGLPARAQQATTVIVTASNSTVLQKPILLNISAGADYASTYLSTLSYGLTSLTASSPGLGSSSESLNIVNSPSNATLTATTYLIYTNESSTLIARVDALNQGVQGAQIKWFTTAGVLSTANSTTSAAGTSFVTFTNPGATLATVSTVTAEITTPFIGTKNFTTTITVLPVPPKPVKSFYQDISPYLLYIIIAVIAAAAVVFYFLFFRQWRAKRKATAAVSEETQPYDELEPIPGGGDPSIDGGGDPSIDGGGDPSIDGGQGMGGTGEGGEGAPPTEVFGRRWMSGRSVGSSLSLILGKPL
jgi:hypothetical protein